MQWVPRFFSLPSPFTINSPWTIFLLVGVNLVTKTSTHTTPFLSTKVFLTACHNQLTAQYLIPSEYNHNDRFILHTHTTHDDYSINLLLVNRDRCCFLFVPLQLLTVYSLLYRQPLVTGTSVIALKYRDGVMMAADMLGMLEWKHLIGGEYPLSNNMETRLLWFACSIP